MPSYQGSRSSVRAASPLSREPYRQRYDYTADRGTAEPDLTVVARRLDGPEQVVRAGLADRATSNGTVENMVMVTGIDIPTAGCREIAARYAPARDNVQTLTYTVWVEP